MIKINQIFTSFDGEISPFHQGKITTFIRMAGCNFYRDGGCSYCDSKPAQVFNEKTDRIIPSEKLLKQFFDTHIAKSGVEKITITGGEPLIQEEGVYLLSHMALEKGLFVTVETNGSIIPTMPIAHPKFGYVVDYKLPSSGMQHKMVNLGGLLTKNDVWKFVIGNYDDYKFARNIVRKMGNFVEALIAFQPVFGAVHPKLLLEWMIKDSLYKPIISVQIHKIYGVQ